MDLTSFYHSKFYVLNLMCTTKDKVFFFAFVSLQPFLITLRNVKKLLELSGRKLGSIYYWALNQVSYKEKAYIRLFKNEKSSVLES